MSHQDPGFIDHVLNKKAEVVRVYLPSDANTLLVVTEHCLRSRNLVNVIVADKLDAHRRHVEEHGIDLPEILDWRWRGADATAVADEGST